MLSFANKKAIKTVITLGGTGTFASTSNNQITLQGFRSVIDIDKGGGQMAGTLRAAIYGVAQSDMNSITTLMWGPRQVKPNTIEVYAIDGAQETLVFQGNIVQAWGNYQSQPDVFLQIQAQSGYFEQLIPAAPNSFKGTIDGAVLMGQIVKKMGFVFENNGVNFPLSNPYLSNTLLEQVKSLARMMNCDLYIDNNVIAITPSTQPRNTAILEVSPQSGLNGYPTFDGVGVNFQMYFNPGLVFGGAINVVSSIPRASGKWVVASVSHKLESEKPGGVWLSTVRGNLSGLAITSA